MKENIYIDLNEDVQSVISKIQESESEQVDLIVPTGARVLQNIVDTHLIREAGVNADKVLTVVTSDLMGKIFAQRAGLSVASENGANEESIFGATAIAGGRMSDIVPRKNTAIMASKSAVKAGPFAPVKPLSFSKIKSAGSKKNMPAGEAAKNKGEIGAGFLKSYREERSRNNIFDDLNKINRRKSFLPFKISVTAVVAGIVILTALTGVVVFSKTLPKAEIIIYPARESVEDSVDVFVSSRDFQADLAKGIIPGELLTLEKNENGEFSATGQKEVSQKAKGKIIIYNNYSSQAQAFVASRFQAEAGKIFWTTKGLTVPGAVIKDGKTTPGQITAEVIAAEPGEAYNIGPSKFIMPALKNTPKAEKIYAMSESAMAGGQTGRATVVSNDDVNKAYDSLKEKIKPQFQGLKQNLPVGFQLWPEAYNEELTESSSAPEAGEAADKFKVNVKMVARAIVFRSQDLDNYINQQISAGLKDGKTLLASSKEVSFIKPPVVDYQKNTITASLLVRYDVIDNFDAEDFKKSILNKKIQDVNKIKSGYKNIERVEVNFWPFWVRRVSSNPDRVTIKIVGM